MGYRRYTAQYKAKIIFDLFFRRIKGFFFRRQKKFHDIPYVTG